MPVGCVGQQVIVITDLNGNRSTIGIFQILPVSAIGMQDTAAAAALWYTDQAAVMAGNSWQEIQVQASVGSAQGSCPSAEAFAAHTDLFLANQKTFVTGEAFFSFSQHSTNGFLNISVLY